MNFEYNDIQLPEDGRFKISPSSIDKFFSFPSIWYEENILKEKGFVGSAATVLGTVIHALAESFAKGEPTSREECDAYIDEMCKTVEDLNLPASPNDDPDDEGAFKKSDEIKALYPDMAAILINDYIQQAPKATGIETEVCAHIENGVYIAGTLDRRENDMIVDYKNVAKKPNTEKIPFGYFIQMMAYAYADREKGIFTDRIRLVYTVRPTKTLGVRLFTVTQQISDEDWKMIEDTLALISDTVQLHWAMPELDYIVFKSMRFQEGYEEAYNNQKVSG